MKTAKLKKILVSTDMDLLGEIMNITGETNKTAVFQTALKEYCRKFGMVHKMLFLGNTLQTGYV